ncbi:MAG: adenylate/guanylate cyclase domain-containing protein [Gracilimonas sp.]|uniref:CHASE2 domain-containing protein n=1 Tax=Gracilimonas sp. TaxID=1974203 RepID=UPI0019C63E0C|nr:adenylate/guanylate cyclase domain-containing protein [Gracilimonas sp.]MBD3617523.1 adenylate/guanylate cyclase domain-containing protein [Gracilimonas sp.]
MAKNKSSKKRVASVLLIAVSAFIASFLLMLFKPVQILELKYNDRLFEWRGPLDVSDSPIVLVAISQQADEEIPQKYPWPTNLHARLVDNLNRAGAKAIVFDVVFDNRDRYDSKNDTLFAEALKRHKNVILAGELQRSETEVSNKTSTMFPIPVLSVNNPNPVALVRVYLDLDGAVRSYRFGDRHLEQSYYRLSLEAIRKYKEISYEDIDPIGPNPESEYFNFGPFDILKDRPNSFLINFYGPEGIFPEVSYEEVIDDSGYTTVFESELEFGINSFDDPEIGHLNLGTFEDKIVIVGATMPLLKDFYATPFANDGNNARPGYEIHANAIQTILDSNYIERFRGWYTLLIMLFFCLTITLVNRIFSANLGVLTSILLGGAYFGITYWAFVNHNLLMILTGPLLAVFITQAGMVSYEYYIEQKEKRRIRGMFASYVSPELVNRMIESGEEPQLGGEETYMTAFFSDIVSFSTFSEQLEAKELVKLINEYLSSMTNILNERGGTLDKYIGDAIVAFFGSPVYMEDHALQACVTSQLMQKELNVLREKWAEDGWPDIVTNMQQRMGMNTGMMVTGNMGSSRRFNYTMMGDNVNLAARCESGAKQYGVFTMVTEATKIEAEKFGDACVFRQLDNIVVKGRTKPVKMFEIADLKDDAGQQLYDCVGLYEEGLEYYFNRDWDKAKSKFMESLTLERYEQNPSGIFIERCEMMKKNPPAEDWNGVFIMESK